MPRLWPADARLARRQELQALDRALRRVCVVAAVTFRKEPHLGTILAGWLRGRGGVQVEPWQLSGALLRQRVIQTIDARLDSSNVRGRMIFSLLSLSKKLPTLGGEGESSKSLSCVGFDRAKRAPYPRFLEGRRMTGEALVFLLQVIVISSASAARQQRVLLRRRGRMLEPKRERRQRESHGECRGVSLSVRQGLSERD